MKSKNIYTTMKTCLIFVMMVILGGSVFAQEFSKKSSEFYVDTQKAKENIKASIPNVIWIEPQDVKYNSKGNNVKIRIKITSEVPIREIKIEIKDSRSGEVMGTRGVELDTASVYEKMIDQEISLMKGENTVVCQAVNREGGTSFASKTIVVGETAIADAIALDRHDYALLFATDEYKEFSKLTNPVFDASTLSQELTDNYGFKVELVKNPTNDQIFAKIREYISKSYGDYDQLLILFAGHGTFDETLDQGYVVATNSNRNDPSKSSYIAHESLRKAINNIKCKHILLLMDVCFGGTFDPVVASERGDDIYKDMPTQEYLMKKLKYNTRKYITSGGKEYVPDGRPGMHSPFMRRFLEALRSFGGSDKILTLTDVTQSLERAVPQPRFGEFGDNQPGSDFVFVAK
jgi:hypothetical protein